MTAHTVRGGHCCCVRSYRCIRVRGVRTTSSAPISKVPFIGHIAARTDRRCKVGRITQRCRTVVVGTQPGYRLINCDNCRISEINKSSSSRYSSSIQSNCRISMCNNAPSTCRRSITEIPSKVKSTAYGDRCSQSGWIPQGCRAVVCSD